MAYKCYSMPFGETPSTISDLSVNITTGEIYYQGDRVFKASFGDPDNRREFSAREIVHWVATGKMPAPNTIHRVQSGGGYSEGVDGIENLRDDTETALEQFARLKEARKQYNRDYLQKLRERRRAKAHSERMEWVERTISRPDAREYITKESLRMNLAMLKRRLERYRSYHDSRYNLYVEVYAERVSDWQTFTYNPGLYMTVIDILKQHFDEGRGVFASRYWTAEMVALHCKHNLPSYHLSVDDIRILFKYSDEVIKIDARHQVPVLIVDKKGVLLTERVGRTYVKKASPRYTFAGQPLDLSHTKAIEALHRHHIADKDLRRRTNV